MIDPEIREDLPAVSAKTLRQFAVLTLVIVGGMAAWDGVVRHRTVAASILAAIAAVVGLVGIAWPERIRPLYTTLVAVTTPIGRVVSIALLGVLFYGLFTPLACIFRLFGRDALSIRRTSRASYWSVKPAVTDVRSYMRQS